MAAPRLHLGHVSSRGGISEDEEVEVLRSGVQDEDDIENNHDTTRSNSQQRRHHNLEIDDRRSETSTPEADASSVQAALFSSTTSEAVPDHQQASDRLQNQNQFNRNQHIPNAQSTPNDSAARVESVPVPIAAVRDATWSEEQMKRALAFFFLNPLEKYRLTKRFPWKLFLQIVKIFFVTTQLVIFGDLRMGHAMFSAKTQTALRHLFMANWTSDRDLLIYPPNVPPFSIYEVNDFYNHLNYAVKKYYILPNVTVATLVYDCHPSLIEEQELSRCQPPPISFCVELLQAAESHLANRTYHYDMRTVTTCVELDLNETVWSGNNFDIRDSLEEHNITIKRQKFVAATLSFRLKTIYLKHLQPADEPDCFHLTVNIIYDNSAHTGDILVTLETDEKFINCEGSINYPTYNIAMAIIVALLDTIVLCTCFASLILCLRGVVRARQLYIRTLKYFQINFNRDLRKDDQLKFVNLWYILILINDVCLILGTIFKLNIEYQHFNSSLFTATGMLLGIGTLIVWLGILRYLAFFPKYNVLIITLKRSLPSVLRFMACAGLLYAGFVFCGWVVLGPYHMKFRTLMMTSECLFALLNGDDMFATFSTTGTSGGAEVIVWFARLYLYLFIVLFTYVVLSLFISIIMESYEVMKDRQQSPNEQSELETFLGMNADGGGDYSGFLGQSPPNNDDCISHIRRRLSRQRSTHSTDQPYVRFNNEPQVINDAQN